jgi:hypothetical protein
MGKQGSIVSSELISLINSNAPRLQGGEPR